MDTGFFLGELEPPPEDLASSLIAEWLHCILWNHPRVCTED